MRFSLLVCVCGELAADAVAAAEAHAAVGSTAAPAIAAIAVMKWRRGFAGSSMGNGSIGKHRVVVG